MRDQTRNSSCWQVGASVLCAAAGLAVAAGDGTSDRPTRIEDAQVRQMEVAALVGPVITNEAMPMPENRARLSRVTVISGAERVAGQVSGLDAIDDDPGTGITLADGRGSVELTFIGAPRWISNLRVDSNANAISAEYLDLDRKWRPFGAAAGGQTIDGELVQAMGLRVTPVTTARDAGDVLIRDIDAWMQQTDPDDGVTYGRASMITGEYFYEWCEAYSSSPLSKCREECEGLKNEIPSSWSRWGFGNSSSWESDFKRSALGGSENSYVDANDLVYFAGHGSSAYDSTWNRTARNLLFSRTDRDDSAHVPGDSYDSWGDLDMEWMCFAACQLMKDDGYWAASLDGAHLIMGWHTNMRDVTMGIDFGSRAVDGGIFDSAHTVLGSWLWAAEKNHGSGYTAKVVGENTAMGNDYLWGEGFVNPDPVDDSTYTLWTYNTSGAIQDPAAGDRTAGMSWADPEEDRRDPGFDTTPVVLRAKGADAIEITVPQGLLDRERGAVPMKVYQLQLPAVQADYVAQIAGQICQQTGLFCQSDIGPTDDKTEYIATDGPWQLIVSAQTGAIQLVDTSQFGVPYEKIPQLPTPGQAAELALNDLGKLGLLPRDASLMAADSLTQGEIPDADQIGPAPQPVLAAPAPILQRVLFNRNIDGYPVAGPSGELVAHIGQFGLAQVQSHGWNPVEAIGETNTIPIDEVLIGLSKNPSAYAIDGMTIIPESIKVVDVQMSYFPSANGLLRPAYQILCDIQERTGPNADPQNSLLEVNAWADTELPAVQIVAGNECVDFGKDLCFGANVFGGFPPYTFEWSDPVSGVVGSSSEVCYPPDPGLELGDAAGDQVNAPGPHITDQQTRTVQLRVTDAMGTVANAFYTLPVCTPPCPADLNGDGFLDNGDIGLFIELFLSGNLAVDFNNDGFLDNGDIGAFINAFLQGC